MKKRSGIYFKPTRVKCKVCRERFIAMYPNKEYCSVECYQRYNTPNRSYSEIFQNMFPENFFKFLTLMASATYFIVFTPGTSSIYRKFTTHPERRMILAALTKVWEYINENWDKVLVEMDAEMVQRGIGYVFILTPKDGDFVRKIFPDIIKLLQNDLEIQRYYKVPLYVSPQAPSESTEPSRAIGEGVNLQNVPSDCKHSRRKRTWATKSGVVYERYICEECGAILDEKPIMR